ncbi:MAG: hypothetical protein DMD81_17695 [Candidatus Rokuibacteriota bacterium]|nr:MAG: hypothetical protein DMD81_17695 [Candidatus Rokubacteria bacterium]
MILMTGPTGSGKSTTLHTALKAIKTPRKNIVTVEDPVEYRQAGILQVEVKGEIGFDFARSLRAILRQDPDVIMVGEIRDEETAHVAVRAVDPDTGQITILKYVMVHDCGRQLHPVIVEGQMMGGLLQGLGVPLGERLAYDDAGQLLTGSLMDYPIPRAADVPDVVSEHLVFSTLHASDAVSTVTRLVNLGVEPFLVATAVNLAAAQRLVRKICPHCKEAYAPEPDERVMLADIAWTNVLYRGKGCLRCRHTGFLGRVALYEMLRITGDIREMIRSESSTDYLQKIATENGMLTLRHAGLRKVVQGITTLEEVLAVVAE